jgi:LysM repeat protein
MARSLVPLLLSPALMLPLLVACGGGAPPPAASMEPVVLGDALPAPERVPEVTPDPDPDPRERWQAPFAVSSSGRLAVRERRSVVVLGADPGITVLAAPDPEPAPGASQRPEPSADARPSAPAEREASPATHMVGETDTLWGIASRYRVAPEALRELNHLPDDRVVPGQVLLLPESNGR